MNQKTKFKQTEIGKIPEDWEFKPLNEVVEINPKRDLKKGTKSKYVSMHDLKEFNKKIQGFIFRNFNGGSKFQNGDTVMARITPCLENGKTAFVDILDEKEIAAGSTEFIVLSGKEGETINEFVYYLSRSPKMRADAIASMTGTSGRQRVQTDLLGIKEVLVPPISEQQSIASILSSLDAKIELNKKINQTLESIGQALFKKWFVDSEYENEERELGELIGFVKGKKPGEVFDKPLDNTLPQILIDVLDGSTPKYTLIKDNSVVINTHEVLMVMDGASSGRVEIGFHGILGSTLAKIKSIDSIISDYYLYYFLRARQEDIRNNTTGTSIPHADKGKIKKFALKIPNKEILVNFDKMAKQLHEKICINKNEIERLSKIRDLLLPKLMSGEIRVK